MPKPGEEVDLASKLEDYLLKICSGEITGANASLNLAEVASLLQGSVQGYSRKVQYLYNVVLHSLETLSQNRPEQSEGTSGSHAVSDEEEGTSVSDEEEGTSVSDEEEGTSVSDEEEGTSVSDEEEGTSVSDEEDDQFWCPDDVPVEANNSLDASTSEDASFYPFVKPPAANLVVLEGDCLDTSGDGGELESYQLATYDLYRDFILLDPCDSVAVDDFLKGDEIGKVPNRPLVADYSVGVNNCNVEPDLPALDDGCLEPENLEDSEDDDDNPGNLEDSEDDDDNDGAQGICNLNLD